MHSHYRVICIGEFRKGIKWTFLAKILLSWLLQHFDLTKANWCTHSSILLILFQSKIGGKKIIFIFPLIWDGKYDDLHVKFNHFVFTHKGFQLFFHDALIGCSQVSTYLFSFSVCTSDKYMNVHDLTKIIQTFLL